MEQSFTCTYCNKDLSRRSYLQKHQENCKKKATIEQQVQYEEQLKTQQLQYEEQLKAQQLQYEERLKAQQAQYEEQLKAQQAQYELKLFHLKEQFAEFKEQDLKEQLAEFKEQLFEIAKQPKNIQNNYSTKNTYNQRNLIVMNQLAPYNLTEERVQNIVEREFTEEIYRKGPQGITQFVVDHILTDSVTGKRIVVCTDAARKKIKMLGPDGKTLQEDPGMHKTMEIVTPPLSLANALMSAKDRDYTQYHKNSHYISCRGKFTSHLVGHLLIQGDDEISDSE